MVQPIYHLDFIWKLTKSYQKLQKYHRFGRDIFNKVLQEFIEFNFQHELILRIKFIADIE